MEQQHGNWWRSGAPWIWLNAAAVAACVIGVLGLLALITVRGLAHFWPADVVQLQYQEPTAPAQMIIGETVTVEDVAVTRLQGADIAVETDATHVIRKLVKIGNREVYGADFRFVLEPWITGSSKPADLLTVERQEWGNQYGYLRAVLENGRVVAQGDTAWPVFQQRAARAQEIREQIQTIQHSEIGAINYALEQVRLDERRLELDGEVSEEQRTAFAQQRIELNEKYDILQQQLGELYTALQRDSYQLEVMGGKTVTTDMAQVVRAYKPNAMSVLTKLQLYGARFWEFISAEPREANTEGGVFPAIFGTVLMVLLMSVVVTPLGVVAAVYLKEYATQGWLTRVIRIAVNNLAGVPAIVYGVFGLGFFVYFLGGNIDRLFFPAALPAPTFGTGGILWASLTLALLTLPVVIVATEEGLARIPRSVREGSYALGATKAETLWRTVLPMASPAMMTGLILAVARAAGEVAPLMLVGVVKLAPSLPLDGNFPFLHLERKFMHLGFHIYDVGFQSPNVEAARPLVYATAFLLILIILVLNLAAVRVRNNLREKYRALET